MDYRKAYTVAVSALHEIKDKGDEFGNIADEALVDIQKMETICLTPDNDITMKAVNSRGLSYATHLPQYRPRDNSLRSFAQWG